MDPLKANTPEKLYQAIGEFLQSVYSQEDLKTFYDNARKHAHGFLVSYPVLPHVPTLNKDPLDGLQGVRQWCVNADKIVDDIVGNLRPQAIRESINLFKKLRDIADGVLHVVNGRLRERIENETTAKSEREYNRRTKELRERIEKEAKSGPGILSSLVVEAQIRAQVLREMGFKLGDNDALQAYLSEDPTFQDRLSELHVHEKIRRVMENIDELVGSNTTDGRSLDLYCKLKDIPLKEQFGDVSYSYSLKSLHDVIFGNCSWLYSSVDTVIHTLEEIQRKAKQNTLPKESGRTRDRRQATPETSKLKVEPIRDQVFICYSHKDKRWLADLQTHLTPYVRNGSMTTWSDKQIVPGSKWFSEIKAALASTKVAVLLVTPNFLASDFIHQHELTPLLKEAEKDDVRIIWIPVRACSYEQTPLKDCQAAVDPKKPLANMKAERDKAWVEICKEIEKAVGR